MVIYADILLVVNFIISYFLLLASALLAGYTYKRKRIIAAAALGALFCLYIFVQPQAVAINLTVRILSLAACSITAFGFDNKRKLLVQTVCYLFFNMLVTGAAMLVSLKTTAVYHNNLFFYFKINPVVLVLSSGIIYLLIIVFEAVKEKVSPQTIYKMEIVFESFVLKDINAFYDSGFNVKDIVSNKDVIMLSTAKMSEKIPNNVAADIELFLKGEYKNITTAFVPVFLNTVTGNGMVPSIKAKYILIENKRIENVLAAFTDNSLSENVSALFGTDIKRQV